MATVAGPPRAAKSIALILLGQEQQRPNRDNRDQGEDQHEFGERLTSLVQTRWVDLFLPPFDTVGVRNVGLSVAIAVLVLLAVITLAAPSFAAPGETVLHASDCCGGATAAFQGVPVVSR
jgi:hypothetical protein